MNIIDIIRKARAVIADPKHWTKGHYVLRTEEEPKYCAVGAIHEIIGHSLGQMEFEQLFNRSEAMLTYRNDASYTTHEDMLAYYDAWIKELEHHAQ